MCRMSPEALVEVEAKALAETKALAASGRRRTHAAMLVFRVKGPLLAEAAAHDIDFCSGINGQKMGWLKTLCQSRVLWSSKMMTWWCLTLMVYLAWMRRTVSNSISMLLVNCRAGFFLF